MHHPTVIIGAGASGLMCAYEAARRGCRVLLIDHRNDIAGKLLVSGGGKCNFTNRIVDDRSYLSGNPHFVKSALARFTPEDFMRMLDEHRIAYEEREGGKLFLAGPARLIRDMLLQKARGAGAKLVIGKVSAIEKRNDFRIAGSFGSIDATCLVIATGGLSYPKLGASDLGYRVAKKFGHNIVPCRPALVPLMFAQADRMRFSALSGISFRARIGLRDVSITDECLITHRGLSGPAILRISAHWEKGKALTIDPLPGVDLAGELEAKHTAGSRMLVKTVIARYVAARFADLLAGDMAHKPIATCAVRELRATAAAIHNLTMVPKGTEGYAAAEATAGGVATGEISSKTMESKLCPGLYFIGELVDVTGDLGGYNLHWAWASGHAAGSSLA